MSPSFSFSTFLFHSSLYPPFLSYLLLRHFCFQLIKWKSYNWIPNISRYEGLSLCNLFFLTFLLSLFYLFSGRLSNGVTNIIIAVVVTLLNEIFYLALTMVVLYHSISTYIPSRVWARTCVRIKSHANIRSFSGVRSIIERRSPDNLHYYWMREILHVKYYSKSLFKFKLEIFKNYAPKCILFTKWDKIHDLTIIINVPMIQWGWERGLNCMYSITFCIIINNFTQHTFGFVSP